MVYDFHGKAAFDSNTSTSGGHNVLSKVEVNERKMKLGSLSRLQKKHNILSQMSLAMDREEVTHGIMGLQ